MKTIRQHFEENLTEEELEKALANTGEFILNSDEPTPGSALMNAFPWEETHEGAKYWYFIHKRLLNQPK